MPRRARLDAPGTLHHVMVRGIERRREKGEKGIYTDKELKVTKVNKVQEIVQSELKFKVTKVEEKKRKFRTQINTDAHGSAGKRSFWSGGKFSGLVFFGLIYD
jgi:hypothetical protein